MFAIGVRLAVDSQCCSGKNGLTYFYNHTAMLEPFISSQGTVCMFNDDVITFAAVCYLARTTCFM
ncbi:hypothetical protein D3C87_1403290 [compost metagenome]